MAFTLVQNPASVVETVFYDGSISATFSSNPVVGNLIVVTGGGGSQPTTYSVIDNKSNSYTVRQSSNAQGYSVYIAWAYVVNTGAGFQVTVTEAGQKDTSINIAEFSGGLTSGIEDVFTIGTQTSNAPFVVAGTTTAAADLVVSAFGGQQSLALTVPPTGYATLAAINGVSHSGFARTVASAWKEVGAAGVQSLTWPDYDASSQVALLIAFKAGASGATVSTITGTTATEGSPVVFTTNMSGTGGGTFAYSWSGTATAADYTDTLTTGMCAVTGGSGSVAVSGSNIIVDSTVTAFTVTVPTTTDTIDEGASEIIRLVVGGVTASSGTITDDDAAPTITGTTSLTATAGSPVVITYSPGLSGQSRTYTLALTDGTATGGTDYDNTIVPGDFAVTGGTGSVTISGSTVTVDPGVTEFTLTIATT